MAGPAAAAQQGHKPRYSRGGILGGVALLLLALGFALHSWANRLPDASARTPVAIPYRDGPGNAPQPAAASPSSETTPPAIRPPPAVQQQTSSVDEVAKTEEPTPTTTTKEPTPAPETPVPKRIDVPDTVPWRSDAQKKSVFFDVNETMIPPVDVDPALQPPGTLPSDTGDIDGPGTSVWDRVRTWAGAAPGAAVGPSDVPVRDGGGVPRRMFTIWNERKLGFRALLLHRRWLGAERGLEHVIVTQDECSELAALRPGFRAVFDALPMVVMRADMCRVLVLYLFGGYWRDLDVDFRRPLGEWVNTWLGLTVGYEDDEHVCTWFFAARPGDVCLGNVLQHMENVVRDAGTINLRKNKEAVIDMTGPGAMTDGLQGCPYGVQFDYQSMRKTLVHHEYAGQQWKSMTDYKSWLKERDSRAHGRSSQPFDPVEHSMSRQEEYMAPVRDDLPPVAIARVDASFVLHDFPPMYGVLNAFDGTIDTYFDSGHGSDENYMAWLSIEFTEPMTIGTVFNPEEVDAHYLAGLRLINRHHEPGLEIFGHDPTHVELYDEDFRRFWLSRKEGRAASLFQYYFAGFRRKVKKIVIRKDSGFRLSYGEIQLCSNPQCTLARKVTIASPEAKDHGGDGFSRMKTITRRCAPSPFHSSPQFPFAFCDDESEGASRPHERPGAAFALLFGGGTIDRELVYVLRVERHVRLWPVLLPGPNDEMCKSSAGCYTQELFAQSIPVGAAASTSVELVYAEISPREWVTLSDRSALGLMLMLRPRTLFLSVRVTRRGLMSNEAAVNVERLLKAFDVHGVTVDDSHEMLVLRVSMSRKQSGYESRR